MSALVEIAGKAIADYGFRQVVLYSPEDVVAQWGLSSEEASVLRMRDKSLALAPLPAV